MKIYKKIKQNVKFEKLHVIRGDRVQVIAGREKGKTGVVLRINRKTARVLVEKVNMVKRHTRGSGAQKPGGIVEKESPVHLSNVKPYCGKCAKGVRVSRKKNPEGRTVRFCKKCGSEFKRTAK
jgi:large subunit ribosomal protein L24